MFVLNVMLEPKVDLYAVAIPLFKQDSNDEDDWARQTSFGIVFLTEKEAKKRVITKFLQRRNTRDVAIHNVVII